MIFAIVAFRGRIRIYLNSVLDYDKYFYYKSTISPWSDDFTKYEMLADSQY